jgi:outer membrane protein OmpA-like peptidoglycan-associated protein
VRLPLFGLTLVLLVPWPVGCRRGEITAARVVMDLEAGPATISAFRFVRGTADVLPSSRRDVAEVARAIGRIPGRLLVRVTPETSEGLPPDTVQARRRAERVAALLVEAGASAARITTDDSLALQPLAPVAAGEARAILTRIPSPPDTLIDGISRRYP